MERTILHCDCNGFFASVACIKQPELKKVPMAVCGDPESRHGIILAKNELAKGYGIQTAETVWQAKQKCPQLVLVPPEHDEYHHYSKLVNLIYQEYTDLVEPFGIDESWLDVTGSKRLFGDGKTIADQLRKRIREEIGLTISVGVSFNKVFAKLGSDYRKPDATTVISRQNYQEVVYPLPVSALLYVGKNAQETLRHMGVTTIGELARSDKARLHLALGKLGESIWEYANGLEDSPVRHVDDQREIKSVGNGMTFRRNLLGEEDIRVGIKALSDTVGSRLRRYGLKCYGVQLQIKDPDFKVISRQKQLPHATDLTRELAQAAWELVEQSWNLQKPIRMLTVTALNLTERDEGFQTDLFAPQAVQQNERTQKLERAMDAVRARYGKDALRFGDVMKNDLGIGDGTDEKEEP